MPQQQFSKSLLNFSLKNTAISLFVGCILSNSVIYADAKSAPGKEGKLTLGTFIHNEKSASKEDSKMILLAPVPLSPLKDEQTTPANPNPITIPQKLPNAPPYQKHPEPQSNEKRPDPTLDYPISIVLSPLEKAVLSSLIADNIEIITKKMGDPFYKGEVLIKMDQRAFRARVLKARAALDRSRTIFQVKEQLFRDRVASQVELADAESGLNVSIADLLIAEKEFSDTIIIAPFQGHVVDVYVEEFEMVQPGQKMIAIINSGILVAKMLVPSLYLKDLAIGKPIQLRIKETHELINAKITQIGVVIDPASSMVKVFAEIDNRERKLTAGMIGTAKLEDMQKKEEKNKEIYPGTPVHNAPYGLTPPQNKPETRPVTR